MAMAMAMIEMFVKFVYFRNALMAIPSDSVITKKNQRRITIFHLYFIKIKIRANAKANENKIEIKFGVVSFWDV